MADAMVKAAEPGAGLGTFERYLSLWVALCMAAGILIGKMLPGLTASLRGIEFGKGSQINAPIAVLIWLMITPMMMKVDFASIRNVAPWWRRSVARGLTSRRAAAASARRRRAPPPGR